MKMLRNPMLLAVSFAALSASCAGQVTGLDYPPDRPASDGLCDDSTCLYGDCILSTGSTSEYECHCWNGFMGDVCDDYSPSPCYPSTCNYNGICIEMTSESQGDYICNCDEGWSGSSCEIGSEDPCKILSPCSYHSNCTVVQYGPPTAIYSCDCEEGWSGPLCETQDKSDPCHPTPCSDYGHCTVIEDGTPLGVYSCDCDEGWSGPQCERQDPCYPSPCHYHGHCSVILYGPLGEYICDCNEGWLGSQCELQDPCYPSPCHYHGHCSVNQYGPLGEYICDCNEGWSGSQCELQDPCHPSPCNYRGACAVIQSLGIYSCDCDEGWSGSQCETDELAFCTLFCTNGHCSSGSSGDQYCICNSGFYGEYCDFQYFEDDPSHAVGTIIGGLVTAVIFLLIVLGAFVRLRGAASRGRPHRSTQIVVSDAPPPYSCSTIFKPVSMPPAYSSLGSGFSGNDAEAAGQPTAFHNPTAGVAYASSLGQQQGNEYAYANNSYDESPPPPYDGAPSTTAAIV